ncbi:PAS domain-containing protein, partial [Thermodesulfobacteriota bacterium]
MYFFSPSLIIATIIGSSTVFWLLIRNRSLSKKNHVLGNAFNQVTPICVTNKNYEIISANNAYWSKFGKPKEKNQPVKCFEHRPGKSCHSENCPLTHILKGQEEYIWEPQKEYNDELHFYIVTARPFYGKDNEILGVIESFQDITAKKKLENEKEELIINLNEQLDKVKLLSGLIPICASCKKIRDDKGYWNQIESYIKKHSEADFSHGFCPDCVKKLYPVDFFPLV